MLVRVPLTREETFHVESFFFFFFLFPPLFLLVKNERRFVGVEDLELRGWIGKGKRVNVKREMSSFRILE